MNPLWVYLFAFLIFTLAHLQRLRRSGWFERVRFTLGILAISSLCSGSFPPLMATPGGYGCIVASGCFFVPFFCMSFWEPLWFMFLMLLPFGILALGVYIPFGIMRLTMEPDNRPETAAAGFMAILIYLGLAYLSVRTFFSSRKTA